jgi:hypothetical protein
MTFKSNDDPLVCGERGGLEDLALALLRVVRAAGNGTQR